MVAWNAACHPFYMMTVYHASYYQKYFYWPAIAFRAVSYLITTALPALTSL